MSKQSDPARADGPATAGSVLARIRQLPPAERARLMEWAKDRMRTGADAPALISQIERWIQGELRTQVGGSTKCESSSDPMNPTNIRKPHARART